MKVHERWQLERLMQRQTPAQARARLQAWLARHKGWPGQEADDG